MLSNVLLRANEKGEGCILGPQRNEYQIILTKLMLNMSENADSGAMGFGLRNDLQLGSEGGSGQKHYRKQTRVQNQ